jgi:hypothetical protein
MRDRAGSHPLGRATTSALVRGIVGVLAGCLALFLAATALAAGGLSVKSHDWEIGINDGPNHKVAADKSFTYCASKTIGSITPKVVLAAVPTGAEYSFGLTGPAAAGASQQTAGETFTGQGNVIDPAFIPLAFPKLKAQGAESFPPGTYRFTLTVAGAPALTQTVKLVRRSAC